MKLTVSQLCVDEGHSDDEEGLNVWFEMRAAEELLVLLLLKRFVKVSAYLLFHQV